MLNCSECSSCAACANACTRNAISMQLNSEGFYRPIIDEKKCVQCGLCEKVCPSVNIVDNPNNAPKEPQTFAAYAKDEKIRSSSSSGGIFSVLAEQILDNGGVVAGVAQLAKSHFGHIVVENKADLEKLRGSKYVLADVGLVYRDVRSYLKANRTVLFSGTPCQIAGLYAVLGKTATYANLFTVDVVCHGSPSVKVFEKYIAEIEKDKSAFVLSTSFRDKRKGWGLYSMTSSLNTIFGECFQISETVDKNKYLQVFLRNLCLNASCSTCHYAKLPRIADITLGDYWGVDRHHPDMYDDKGTSVVLINTDNGKKLFETVKDKINYRESDIRIAASCQRNITRPSIAHRKRKAFLKDLDYMNFSDLYTKYMTEPTILQKIYRLTWKQLHILKNVFFK